MRFKNKIAVITGGGSGLGQMTALKMAQEGLAGIAIIDRDQIGLKKSIELLSEISTIDILSFNIDVSDAIEMKKISLEIQNKFNAIDILVNAAGILGPSVKIIDCDEDDWDQVFAINVRGTYLSAKYFVPLIRLKGSGSVINFSSTAGLVGSDYLSPYSASKGAIITLTKSMALNHATEGIRVNCVCPGSIETPMLRSTFANAGDNIQQNERELIYKMKHPMHRFGIPDEVASVVLFLASDDASYVTGIAMPIDGGRLA